MAIKRETIKRTIHYYDIEIDFHEDFSTLASDNDLFREFFRVIAKLGETKDVLRYQKIGERKIFIQGVRFDKGGKKIITGMLRCVRSDLFPEIMNTTSDMTKGIEVLEDEGIVETTHFVVDYTKKTKKLAIEYNLYGAKIGDLLTYWDIIGARLKCTKEGIKYKPVVKNELKKLRERLGKCSELIVSVHKDNVDAIANMDRKTYSGLKLMKDQFNPEYATLSLKFDYRQRPDTAEVNSSIGNLITKLLQKPERVSLFNILKAKAEDRENNLKLELFDLLIDRVQSRISVEKVPKYRTVVSVDMFEQMKDEMRKKRL